MVRFISITSARPIEARRNAGENLAGKERATAGSLIPRPPT